MLLFDQKLRNVMDGSILLVAVSTEWNLYVLRPASKHGSVVSKNV